MPIQMGYLWMFFIPYHKYFKKCLLHEASEASVSYTTTWSIVWWHVLLHSHISYRILCTTVNRQLCHTERTRGQWWWGRKYIISYVGFVPYLNDSREDESRPIAPSLSEIQIWERVTFAFAMGSVCTCFKLLEIDVFWPMLVVYFLLLHHS
jgi:hypothetical protein